ncbi:MAG: TlpA family protein disulfide reductase [Planctomycetota bacterium]|jgi:hypothetical protein
MQEKEWEKGFVIIGIHVKQSVHDLALSVCRSYKINFSNYRTGHVDRKGVDGTPTAFFFGADGNLVHKGTFAGHKSILESLLARAPDWLAGPRTYTKVASEADQVRKRVKLGEAAKSLRAKAESEDSQEKEEASVLLSRLERYADRLLKRASNKLESGYPLEAKAMWAEIAKTFSGDVIGEKAAAIEKKMTADPSYEREVKALKIFKAMETVAKRMKPRRRGQTRENWRKRNQTSIHQLLALFRKLEKKYPDTKVFQRAGDFLNSWGLKE